MSLRTFAKTAAYHARRGRVRALAMPRSVAPLRRALHLPSNRVVSPLEATSHDGLRVTVLDRAETFRRALPQLVGDPAALAFFQKRTTEPAYTSYVAELEEGRFWSSPFGAVLTRNDDFVPDFSRDPWGPHLHAIWNRARLPAPRRVAGRALYLVTPEADANYHHWMIDLLPRVMLARRAGFTPQSFSHVFVNACERSFQRETLERCGFTAAQILPLERDDHVCVDSLVVPWLKPTNQAMPLEDVAALRELLLPRTAARGRRIFLSRRDAGFRRLLNEDELHPLLKRHGFEIVSTGTMDVASQARLFAEAEWIAGASGAAFANLVFAPPGARVLEIAPPQWLAVYHWMISARCGLNHTVLLADGDHRTTQPDITGRRRNFTLSPDRLASWLEGETSTQCSANSAA